MDFKAWNQLFADQNLQQFTSNQAGILWLKIKSILRKDLIPDFLDINGISLTEKTLNGQFVELFNLLSKNVANSNKLLDKYIKQKSNDAVRKLRPEKLESELYKVHSFEWGGDYQNSLDKYLVRKYIKTDECSYDDLMSKIEPEIMPTVQSYIRNSWYNYWSSVLIESVFSEHTNVIPGIGKIKSVDFFINQIPFDLKVTYLPAEYIKLKRKYFGFPVELTMLKKEAKNFGISFDSNSSDNNVYYEIKTKMEERDCCKGVLDILNEQYDTIIRHATDNKHELARWLYENQGEMRFGAENRVYLILIDHADVQQSWKLKRNLNLLRPTIHSHIDDLSSICMDDMKLDFTYKSHTYTSLADVIFVINH